MDKQVNSKLEKINILIVTGLSGAGKSTALDLMEDMGFEVVDNLPITLLNNFLKTPPADIPGQDHRTIAIGIDPRTRGFETDHILEAIDVLRRKRKLNVTVVFLDAEDSALIKRFSETRRKHPLATDRPVIDGIEHERSLLENLRSEADFIIDTSDQSVHELRRTLTDIFTSQPNQGMTIQCMSFGFSRGVPRNVDLVFDVRFLRNPHYDETLRPQNGRDDPRIGTYIMQDPNFKPFFKRVSELILSLLPLYQEEGKAYLTVAFGCTGGKHRSVFLAEEMRSLIETSGYKASTVHRDLKDDRK